MAESSALAEEDIDVLAHDAAIEIDASADRVVRFRRPGRKIDAPGIRRMHPHFAEEKSAVRRAQRALRETIEHLLVGKAKIPLGDERLEVDLKTEAD